MTIRSDSRYAETGTILVATEDRGPILTVLPVQPPTSGAYTTYLSREGDTFDLLAFQKYGDPRLWWKIAEINPIIGMPDRISPGTLVRIPQ
jgi:nucleoid-associated protein YgaU